MTHQECTCLSNFNEMLKEHNTEIDITFSVPRDGGPMRAFPKISTSKIETRKRVGPVIAAPTFCPFCGQRYEPKAAEPAAGTTSMSVAMPWRRVDAGAWTVENDEASYITWSAVDCGDGVVALVAIGNRNDAAHDRAIAAIAAVPELVGALEYVLPLVVGMEDRIDRAPTETPWGKVAEQAIRHALVKAGGRAA